MNFPDRSRRLNHYFLASYLLLLAILWPDLTRVVFADLRTAIFAGTVFLTYGLTYLLPAIVVTKLVHRLLRRRIDGGSSLATALVYATAVTTTGLTSLLVYADGFVYGIFGFHLNGFVWNLVTTPGGIESMGGSDASMLTFAAIVAALLLVQVGLLWWLLRCGPHAFWPRRGYTLLLALFLLLAVGERGLYGISEIQAHTPVLLASKAFPFYKPTTLHALAEKLGYEVSKQQRVNLALDPSALNYPLAPLQVETPAKPLNIIWLVAESLRWDMLDPEIMPQTWAFAGQAHRFTQHYSGGNGTRMALFSLFYGLHGPYWFPFKGLQRQPVLMDVLEQQGYRFDLYTSQSFSYPELNQTVFAKMPPEVMHEYTTGLGWERDVKNVDAIIASLKQRDADRPFMTFMFFESPHAQYTFPEESVIRRPYLEEFNYATTAVDRDSERLKNRYVNAIHHVDGQIGRLLETLREENLLDSTIVIFAGDHGEEFMEKGRWGHNSTFSDEQTRVPLVLWVPGSGAGVVDSMTSHLDLPATLMPLFGVRNPASDYSFGIDLLGGEHRESTTVSDWDRIALVCTDYKYVLPMTSKGGMFAETLTKQDQPVTEHVDEVLAAGQQRILGLMKDLKRFTPGR